MRSYEPLVPPKDEQIMHPTVYELFRQIDRWNRNVSMAMGNLSRNRSPDQAQEPPPTPPGIDDHGNLKGLVPTLNPDGSIDDYNDDHTQYALLFGRPDGQELYGSRPGAVTSWSPLGEFILDKVTGVASLTWTTATGKANINAPEATGLIVVLATRTFNTLASGETNYHTAMADSAGNTWSKLKEYSWNYSGAASAHVSVWFCLVTTAITAATGTLTATFSTTDHFRLSMESYAFTMASGLTVTLVDYATDTGTFTATGNTGFDSMTLTALTGETLFLRAIVDQPGSGGPPISFTPTAGFTAFATDHTDSTNTGAGGFGQNARAEFVIRRNDGATSSPFPIQDGDAHTAASIFAAIQISGSSAGSLTLGAADLSDAAKIFLENRDVRFAAGIGGGDFKFDPLGSGGFVGILDFDGITTANRTYTFQNASGTLAFLSDITALGSVYLRLDGSNDPMTGDLNFTDNLAVVFGTGNDAEISYNGTNLVVDPAAGAGTGSLLISSTIRSSGTYAALQHILQVAHSALQGGTTNTTAQTVSLGTITLTDAGLSAGQYGEAQGLDITVTNTNTTKAGLPKTSTVPYVLNLAYNNSRDVIAADAAALRITGTFTGTATSFLQTSVLAIVNGTSTSVATLTGVMGCQFQAHNATSAGGDARGFTGYGNLTHPTATGNGTGVYGFGSNSGNGSSALSVGFYANTVGPGDSRQHYDIIGTKHAIHGAVYITTATVNLKTSTPATHLTLATATAVPNSDLFVGNQAEIDGTLWIDKVGDALVFAEGGNVALGTTTGTKVGTGATQKLGFWNATPVVQDTGWSVSNVTTDRSYDANATSIDELADVLGTLINQLKTYGILGA